ncbi:MAG: hypothetical protein ACKO2P_17170 [Planctomycetota bacterium]
MNGEWRRMIAGNAVDPSLWGLSRTGSEREANADHENRNFCVLSVSRLTDSPAIRLQECSSIHCLSFIAFGPPERLSFDLCGEVLNTSRQVTCSFLIEVAVNIRIVFLKDWPADAMGCTGNDPA